MGDPFEEFGPGSADELEEGDKVAMFVEGDVMGFMPVSMNRQLNSQGRALVAGMQTHVMEIRRRQAEIDQLVVQAREEGMSWAAIGWSVGLTAEGARLKWMEEPDG